MLLIIYIVLIFSYLILVFFYLRFFKTFANYESPKLKPDTPKPPVTVIICVKDEENNLRKHLVQILEQDYPEFEVLVVDDHSRDSSPQLIKHYQERYNHLSYYKLKGKETRGKKQALLAGLQQAKNEIVLLTDADCVPNSDQWISIMTGRFVQENMDVGLGYGPIIREPSAFNWFIRYETQWVALQYLSFALKGLAYMGVGRNLIVKKSLAQKADLKPFLASGDDDFLIQSLKDSNIGIIIDKETHMYSESVKAISKLFSRKARHTTTSFYYPTRVKALLIALPTAGIIYYVCLFVLLFMKQWIVVIVGILAYQPLRRFIFNKIARKLGSDDLGETSILFEALVFIFYALLIPASLFYRRDRW